LFRLAAWTVVVREPELAICYKKRPCRFRNDQSFPILQSPDGLQNPSETKAFAIGKRAGKWSITTVQMGNNFAHTVPRDFGMQGA